MSRPNDTSALAFFDQQAADIDLDSMAGRGYPDVVYFFVVGGEDGGLFKYRYRFNGTAYGFAYTYQWRPGEA